MPVDPTVLAAFVLASAILVVIPGPTIVMVVGQALAHGRRTALASVAGVGLGDLIAASLSLAGVGALLATSAGAFAALKWLGAAYLITIGIRMWRSPVSFAAEAATIVETRRRLVFRDAFLVTLFNPKGIVFFVAFVPQFIDPAKPYAAQAMVFIGIFVLLGIVNAYLYALLATTARGFIRRPRVLRSATRTGAACLIGAGVLSAFAPRPV
ncbi:LysE family translocator [Aurantimonas sp. A3-2-R12]|uniref:LysE family translocator n=1 Tax=Aurantimonas sp. A3-2-R12 TaxID=3114362 RepID=UPI002E199819|nr:LysE family translocator [Aurantimonas sp. A3-2-R12]